MRIMRSEGFGFRVLAQGFKFLDFGFGDVPANFGVLFTGIIGVI